MPHIMYCRKCGEQIEQEDHFCFACGNKITLKASCLPFGDNLDESEERGTPIRNKNALFQRLLVAGGFVTFMLVVVGVIAWTIFKTPVNAGDVIYLEELSRNSEIDLEPCSNCTSVTIDQETYPLSTTTIQGLRPHLLRLARQANGRVGMVTFFNEDKTNRLFDLSFDISGSVIGLNKRDKERGAKELYSDIVMKKVREYLTKDEPILPNDTVIVRLYGPTKRDNPCKEELRFRYTGPEYKAKFLYSIRGNTARIRVGEKLPITETVQDGVIIISDREAMFDRIKQFYVTNLERDNVFCHSHTLLDEHLQRIAPPSDQINAKQERHYVITNDGDFSFAESYVTKYGYSILDLYTNRQRVFNKSRSFCSTSADTFAFIGMDFQNEDRYREALSSFFSIILAPCQIIFRGF